LGIRLGSAVAAPQPALEVHRPKGRWTSLRRLVPAVALMVVSACNGGVSPEITDAEIVRQFLPWADAETQAEIERRYVQAVQDGVAQCMESHGFDYIPVPPEAVRYGPGSGISEEDFARRFGFGVSTDEAYFAAANEALRDTDPNHNYFFALTREEQVSFSDALTGCLDSASMSVGAPESFVAELDQLSAQVLQTPAAIEAFDAWALCMKLPTSFESVRSEEELTSLIRIEFDRVRDRPELLASLIEVEKEMAVRNLECGSTLRNQLAQAASDLERSFIETHRDEIDEQRAILKE